MKSIFGTRQKRREVYLFDPMTGTLRALYKQSTLLPVTYEIDGLTITRVTVFDNHSGKQVFCWRPGGKIEASIEGLNLRNIDFVALYRRLHE